MISYKHSNPKEVVNLFLELIELFVYYQDKNPKVADDLLIHMTYFKDELFGHFDHGSALNILKENAQNMREKHKK